MHLHKLKQERLNVLALLVVVVPAVLVLGISGCGAKPPPATSDPAALPRAAVSPSPTVAQATRVPAALTTGWATYRDPHVAFQVPLPPGWHAGSFPWTTPGGPSYYIVQFFPPHTPVMPSVAAAEKAPELIQITVVSAPPYSTVANDSNFVAEASPVAIGNTSATLYDRHFAGEGVEVLRIAYVQQGTLQFSFNLHLQLENYTESVLDPAEVNRDTALYLGMLQGFHLATT
jgi:hypothetical protein